jgi:hypothetical protein
MTGQGPVSNWTLTHSHFKNTDGDLYKRDILWSTTYKVFEIPQGIGGISIIIVSFPVSSTEWSQRDCGKQKLLQNSKFGVILE